MALGDKRWTTRKIPMPRSAQTTDIPQPTMTESIWPFQRAAAVSSNTVLGSTGKASTDMQQVQKELSQEQVQDVEFFDLF
jgi:hypothetical protein